MPDKKPFAQSATLPTNPHNPKPISKKRPFSIKVYF